MLPFRSKISKFNRHIHIKPDQVHSTLKRNILTDGYNIVFDMERSSGSYLVDSISGKKFLDMFSFFGSCAISHNHPKLNTTEFRNKIGKVAIHNPSNADIYTIEFAEFVDTFNRVCVPADFPHLFLISTGTLAVENALKVSFDYKTRKNMTKGIDQLGSKVIHFKEAFHGRSGYSLSLTNTDPTKYMYFPLFDWPRVLNPKMHFPMDGQNLIKVLEAEEISLGQIRDILHEDNHSISSIILEPVQAEGGDHHFRQEFWQKLRQIADEYDVMLIADEVQSGMGLTGKMWAFEHMDAKPDIICFGKKAQVCGIICNTKVDEIPDNVFTVSSRISSTWGGNLTDMVRSNKIIEIIEEDNLVSNASHMGKYLLEQLHNLSLKYNSKISNVRGKGLMCAFDLVDGPTCAKLIELAYINQLILLSCGIKSIRLRPMLDVTKTDINKLIEILDHCLAKL